MTEVNDAEHKRAIVTALNVALLDKLTDKLKLKNDAALARVMKVSPPVISKLRNGFLPFGPTYIIMAHELTGWTIREIKEWLGLSSLASLRKN